MVKKIFMCECHTEGITIERIDKQIYISFFSDLFIERQFSIKSIFLKLKAAYKILTKGTYLYFDLFLDKKTAIELEKNLKKLINDMTQENEE